MILSKFQYINNTIYGGTGWCGMARHTTLGHYTRSHTPKLLCLCVCVRATAQCCCSFASLTHRLSPPVWNLHWIIHERKCVLAMMRKSNQYRQFDSRQVKQFDYIYIYFIYTLRSLCGLDWTEVLSHSMFVWVYIGCTNVYSTCLWYTHWSYIYILHLTHHGMFQLQHKTSIRYYTHKCLFVLSFIFCLVLFLLFWFLKFSIHFINGQQQQKYWMNWSTMSMSMMMNKWDEHFMK